MKDEKFRNNIIHYIKDELETYEKEMFEKELANNPALVDEYNDVKSNLNLISKYPEEDAPQGFLLNLRGKIGEITQDKTPMREIKKKAKFYASVTFYVKFTAAAVLLFVLIFTLFNSFGTADKPDVPNVIGKVASMSGVVLIQDSPDTYPKRIVQNEELKDKQIIKTGDNSYVNLVFPSTTGETDRLYLQENTEIQIYGSQTGSIKDSNFKIQNIELIKGDVYLDVVSRNSKNDNKSEGAKQFTDAPFYVKTPNVEARVRGTQFKVNYDDEKNVSEVFVSKGRVDVYSNKINNLERVEEGYFCVIGSTKDLKEMYPGLKNIENVDESIINRPLLDIKAEVVENQSIKIVLINNFYNVLRLSYYENRDNIGIRYEFPSDDAVSLNWSPVRRLIADLEPGEIKSFEYSIPEILRSEIAGNYYLQAVYSGNIEIPNFPPFSEDSEKINNWRMLSGQLYSNRVAIVLNGK